MLDDSASAMPIQGYQGVKARVSTNLMHHWSLRSLRQGLQCEQPWLTLPSLWSARCNFFRHLVDCTTQTRIFTNDCTSPCGEPPTCSAKILNRLTQATSTRTRPVNSPSIYHPIHGTRLEIDIAFESVYLLSNLSCDRLHLRESFLALTPRFREYDWR